MQRSTERIFTTHVGSLPRPPDLLASMRARARGEPGDPQAYAAGVGGGGGERGGKRVGAGGDVVDGGERGKRGFIHYVNERLAGFEPSRAPGGSPGKNSREVRASPDFYKWFGKTLPSPAA